MKRGLPDFFAIKSMKRSENKRTFLEIQILTYIFSMYTCLIYGVYINIFMYIH